MATILFSDQCRLFVLFEGCITIFYGDEQQVTVTTNVLSLCDQTDGGRRGLIVKTDGQAYEYYVPATGLSFSLTCLGRAMDENSACYTENNCCVVRRGPNDAMKFPGDVPCRVPGWMAAGHFRVLWGPHTVSYDGGCLYRWKNMNTVRWRWEAPDVRMFEQDATSVVAAGPDWVACLDGETGALLFHENTREPVLALSRGAQHYAVARDGAVWSTPIAREPRKICSSDGVQCVAYGMCGYIVAVHHGNEIRVYLQNGTCIMVTDAISRLSDIQCYGNSVVERYDGKTRIYPVKTPIDN